jgi:hypothetical protein
MVWLAAALVLILGVVVYSLTRTPARVTATGQPPSPAAQQPASVPPSSPASAPPSSGQAPGLTDGIYEVGGDIRPGTYFTSVPAGHGCYWARLRSFGRPDSIIADRNLDPGEQARVVVESGDRGFKVSNGCTWQRAL